MKTHGIGELIQQEREGARRSITQLAQASGVPAIYLVALETGHLEELPPAVYVRGYVRAVARALGHEPENMLAVLRRDLVEDTRGYMSERARATAHRSQLRYLIRWPLVALIAVTSTVLLYITAVWLFAQRPPTLTLESPADLSVISAASVLVKGQTAADVRLLLNEQPLSVRPDGSFETELLLPTQGPHTLTVEATDPQGRQARLQRTVIVQP